MSVVTGATQNLLAARGKRALARSASASATPTEPPEPCRVVGAKKSGQEKKQIMITNINTYHHTAFRH